MNSKPGTPSAAADSRTVILVVDDNHAMCDAKSRILTGAGFAVHAAESGEEALRLIHAHRPDLVVLGVKLPDMDGIEVCGRIKADPSTSHVIVLQTSATFVEGNDRVRALEGGADSYLVEPMAPEELIANVKALLRLRKAEKDLLKRLQAARVEAEEAKHLKDEFLAIVSHELRTPLNAIIGWVHLLRTGQLDAAASKRAVESIERSAQSQSQLINDLLDVSRIISGKLRLNVSSIAPVAVVETAIDTVRPVAQAKNIHLNVDLDRSIGSTGADPDRLQQVVWNLLTNAIKFCGRDGNVSVRLRGAGSNIELVVEDDGAGIDARFLPFVFHPFRQADGSSTRKHPGLGLGLAIVRQLVELHGGHVSASSPGPGKGSTFTVTLPVRPAAEGRASGSQHVLHVTGTMTPETTPDLSGVTVLVVDDDEDAREILATALGQAGASVAKAASANEALAYFDHTLPAVLLSDIGMPEQDGYMFIRSLRNRSPERGGRVPAIALTAYARSDDRFRALASGFQMHVAKPVDVNELLGIVASLAGRKG